MKEIPGYKIVKKLGRGGMASVYLAVQKSVNRYVALKVMSADLVGETTFTQRFLREARIAARFRHPNIIAILDISTADGVPYIAMEYIPGGELDAERIQSMTLQQKLSTIVQIADALGFLHQQGFVHRDIKPGNILFREDDTAVLTDFGIASDQTATSGLTLTGYIMGTPHYLSPEQAQGKPVDARSDIYSMGVMLFRVLTNKLPYVADDAISICNMHVNAEIPDLPESLAQFDPVVKKAMAKKPADRHQTAGELIEHLISVTGSETAQLLQRSVEGVALEAVDPDEITVEQTAVDNFSDLTVRDSSVTPVHIMSDKRTIQTRSHPFAKLPGWVRFGVVPGAVLAVAAVLVVGSLDDDPEQAAATPETAQSPPGVAAAAAEEAPPPAEPEVSRADELLASGRRAYEEGRLARPAGDNAIHFYNLVLELEPGNELARAGIQVISRELLDEGAVKLDAGDYGGVARILADLEPIRDFAERGYADLQQRLSAALKPVEDHAEEIADLLADGFEYLADNKLTVPAGANAVESFEAVLALDPANARAADGIRQVGERYLVLARDALERGRRDQAEEFWLKSDRYAGELPGAADLRRQIDAWQEPAAVAASAAPAASEPIAAGGLSKEIMPYRLPDVQVGADESAGSLQDRADQALQSDKLLAYALYKEAWKKDPGYGHAARRLNGAAGRYLNAATRDVSDGDLEAAYENLSKALALDPGHEKWNATRREYLTALERQQRSSAGGPSAGFVSEVRISALLGDAESNHQAFRDDSNNLAAATRAADRYVEILQIDANNGTARAGLSRLFSDVVGATQLAVAQQRRADAVDLYAIADRIKPGDPQLLELQDLLR